MNKVFILAGTSEQARLLARWHDMAPHEWRYVADADYLLGHKRHQTMWLFGTWHQRSDARVCLDTAYANGLYVFTIEDDRHVANVLKTASGDTKKDTIEMARDAGIEFQTNTGLTGRTRTTTMGSQSIESIERLVELARADEREACAKVADEYANGLERNYSENIADAIRARGETK